MAVAFGFQVLIMELSVALSVIPIYVLLRRRLSHLQAMGLIVIFGLLLFPFYAVLNETYKTPDGLNYTGPHTFNSNVILIAALVLFFAPYYIFKGNYSGLGSN